MEFLDQNLSFTDREEKEFSLMMEAQREILEMAGGDEQAMDWVAANAERFKKVINDPQYNFYNLLASDETHAEAIKELKNKVYN